jgi:hypothetical protein
MWPFTKPKRFDDPPDKAVYTTVHVMKEGSPILYIGHELDGDWQFMGAEPIHDYTKVAMVVALSQIIRLDKSVVKVADLPMGYHAERKSGKHKWVVNKTLYSEQEMKDFGFYCSDCGNYHKEIPMAYGHDAPNQYYKIPEEEREKRCVLTGDQCIIDDELYFIRGRIEIKVEAEEEPFAWNVWVELSKEDFERMGDRWEDENRILEKPYKGKLATGLAPYPRTLELPVLVITQAVGFVPNFELVEVDHPLFYEQESGINRERVVDFARQILYNH